MLDLKALSGNPSVDLFIQRAQDVLPDFELTPDNAQDVAAVCIGMDGLPLAIELAAARADVLSPRRLHEALGSRLSLLTSGARDLPARQRTLHAAIEWSYTLLRDDEQRFFRRMAVFQGGSTLKALEEVCNFDRQPGEGADVLQRLEALVRKSLLYTRDYRDGEPRYWMLETIQDYAREKLIESGEAEVLEREHALYFMRMAEEAEPLLKDGQLEWLDRLQDEHNNMRAALRWARETRELGESTAGGGSEDNDRDGVTVEAQEIGLRLAGALFWFWSPRGYNREGREQLQAVLSDNGITWVSKPTTVRAKALRQLGYLAYSQSDDNSARSLLTESLAMSRVLGDKQGIASTLQRLGILSNSQGDYESGRSFFEESLATYRELGDKAGIGALLNSLGWMAQFQGDHETARLLLTESLAISRQVGNRTGIAVTLSVLGNIALFQKDYALARKIYEECLEISKEIGDKSRTAGSYLDLGNIAYIQKDYKAARSLLNDGLRMFRELGARSQIAYALSFVASIEGSQGEGKRAARLWGARSILLETIGRTPTPDWVAEHERNIAAVRSQMDETAWESAWAEGRAMRMEDAIEYALENNAG